MSANGAQASPVSGPVALRAHEDARDIVRLFQCPQCSYPLREPLTLPCGNSLCRPCLPTLHKRENITYPLNEGRSEGFICPYTACGLEHSMGDCSTDVTLNKMLDIVKTYINTYTIEAADTSMLLQEQLSWPHVVNTGIEVMPRTRVLNWGRIVSTYIMAGMGELDYSSGISYSPITASTAETIDALDVAVLQNLKEVTRNELECQVCYAVMLDPLTTSCGHTFCRRCVARVLDHSNLCPICRRRLPLAPGVHGEPSNKKLSHMIQGLHTDALTLRLQAVALEDAVDQDASMPLFPCTLAFPMIPTFLHIFEPRYRLMIRRVMESGTRTFGMLMYNAHRQPQGHLGPTHFMQYGTLLHIDRIEMMPDGRSMIESRGTSRFRVLDYAMLDGYTVGRIQRIEDMPIAEEEALEARETSAPAPHEDSPEAQIERMSTQSLLEYGLNFISQSRQRSAVWLHQRILEAYGQPPTDPALFPYWFAR
jgi:Lon protease-like protein